MGSSQRRIAAVALEAPRGTFNTGMNAFNSGLPTIHELKVTPTPIRVDRPTLRLSLTDVADIYSGQATVEVNILAELGGIPPNSGAAAQIYEAPVWADLMRGCGFEELSNSTGKNPKIYRGITGLTGGTAGSPLRHGETVSVTYATSGGPIAGTVVGDFFAEDDLLCIDETSGTAGSGAITVTGATSVRATTGTVVRDTTVPVAFRLRSDINAMESVSIEAYLDGKRWRVKGCMGNVEFIMNHGDVFQGRFTMRGVYNAYGDVALPTNANEIHYIPPVFLGREVRIYEIGASPKGYGRDSGNFANNPGTPSVVGALNRISINTGNEVILRENSLDPAGVSFAIITDRSPSGSFNPDEVLNTDFDFVSKFVSGTPMRFKTMMGPIGSGETLAGDGNTIDIIAPGIVTSSMGDADRDNIQTWDLGFDLTGGDYDPSASGEAPGNDNELTLIYR